MLSGVWVFPVAFIASLVIATLASPAGVSGAVLLLPFQVSVLGTPSPSVTPTNLLYNVFATPGALYRYWRQGQTGGVLTRQLLLGTLPGVILGSIIRVEFLPGPRAFDAVIAFVLIPLGTQLIIRRSVTHPSGWSALMPLIPITMLVGCVGGIYGIGGGSILAPILIGSGRSPSEVAPATLASTFVTSIAGPPRSWCSHSTRTAPLLLIGTSASRLASEGSSAVTAERVFSRTFPKKPFDGSLGLSL